MKIINLLFVQTALMFLKKTISLRCNQREEKEPAEEHGNLLQYADVVHRYEEEMDLQSEEIRLLNWKKTCQEPRVSDQKMSRVCAKIQIVKLSRKLSTSCWMFAT